MKCYPRRYHLRSFGAFPLSFRRHSRRSRWWWLSEASYMLCPIDRTNIRRHFRNPSVPPNFFHLFLPSPSQTRATTGFPKEKNFHLFLPDAVRPTQIRGKLRSWRTILENWRVILEGYQPDKLPTQADSYGRPAAMGTPITTAQDVTTGCTTG